MNLSAPCELRPPSSQLIGGPFLLDASSHPDSAGPSPQQSNSASGTVSGIDDRAILSILVAAIKELAAKIAGFAESFTTKELTFDRAYGHELTVDKLCVGQVCVTETQFMAVFSQSAAAAASISVPSCPSNRSGLDPPISVSSSTPETNPDLTSITLNSGPDRN